MRDNADLQDRTQQLEHLILQLQSETDTIGDYIYLYQQQREQLHRRYQEKDDYIKQLTQDRLGLQVKTNHCYFRFPIYIFLQKKLSELETLLMRGLNKPPTTNTEQRELTHDEIISSDSSNQQQPNTTQVVDETGIRFLVQLIK